MRIRLGLAAIAALAGVLGGQLSSAASLPRVARYGVFEQSLRFATRAATRGRTSTSP